MVSIIILKGVLMKINEYSFLYQTKKTWDKQVMMMRAFKIEHEAEILQFELEYISKVCDYDGDPCREDNFGRPQDLFSRLYSLKYKTKLRILPA